MDEDRIWEIGYPRNDVLVNRQNDTEYIEQIKRDLNLQIRKLSCMSNLERR